MYTMKFLKIYACIVVNQGAFLIRSKSALGLLFSSTKCVELCLFFSHEEQRLRMPHNSKRYQKVISSVSS